MLPQNRFFILLFFFSLFYAGQLKVTTYNLLNFPGRMGYERIEHFRQIMDYLKPDILVVQEMESEFGMRLFRDSVLNYKQPDFSYAPFNDGFDTDNGLFYRHLKVEIMDVLYIPTVHRDIARYHVRIKDSNGDFYIFSVHFKADPEYELMRLQEATTLRNHLDSLEGEYLVMGDFNFYYNEPAYRKLVDSVETSPRGVRDLLNLPEVWHENQNYAYAHTQSTRNELLPDSGAGGGLDDRFDLILCSPGFLDTAGLFLPAESYTVFGNDGRHFNKSINSGINYAVPDGIAKALYFASDHLPVSVTIIDNYKTQIEIVELAIYPNPMRKQASIKLPYFDDFKKARVTITNIIGQRVFELESLNPYVVNISSDKFGAGIYCVHIFIETRFNQYHYQSRLAVIK
uniref:Endonuclease/exonuclease/phosphatase domain-containing protein n=1 Tax=candidate division WOR-3 bacterium TaxID=2052148 RepID=A0A7V3VUG6_UNCW3